MKKVLLPLFILITSAYASVVTITDSYIGGSPNYASYYGRDIIGTPESFDVSSMSVDIDRDAKNLIVSISTGYVNNIGALGTQLGDLFLSTEGWRPQGNASNGYQSDTYKSGDFNYVVALDNHLGTSGIAKLYAITDENVKMSWAPNGYVYRENQAVQATNLSGMSALGIGTWNVDSANKLLNLSIGFGEVFNNAQDFAFHWGMSCANDVIEGSANFSAVPEPNIILLIVFSTICVILHSKFRRIV